MNWFLCPHSTDSLLLLIMMMIFFPYTQLRMCLMWVQWGEAVSMFVSRLSGRTQCLSRADSAACYPPVCLRGVLVERGAAKPDPGSVRSGGTTGALPDLHPDSQRPPSLPPPWIGGLGSAAPLRSMSAEDSSNVGEMETVWWADGPDLSARAGLKRRLSAVSAEVGAPESAG